MPRARVLMSMPMLMLAGDEMRSAGVQSTLRGAV